MLNTIIIEGRCTSDVELKKTQANQDVAIFNIANEDAKKNVTYFSCEAWGKTAEHISKYFKKGDGIEIVGRLTIRKFTRKDGTAGERASIVVETVYFPLSRKQHESAEFDDSNAPA